ncbi:hypothetical protein VTI74DRAFT_7452 [Chaetomium olivicolor]
MRSPILFLLGLATTFASHSTGHTIFTTLFVNDVNQGDGTCIRMPKQGNVCTHPLAGGVNSPDMACGRDGQQAVAFTCPAPAGSKLTLEFRMWADASQPGSIDPSHLGSTAIYLKPVSNITTDSASGPGWFKIYGEGYDTASKKWSTEKLIANHGLLSIDLPSGLPTGYYLARSEIITLQNVTNDYVDPQFYVGCAQLYIQSTAPSLTIPSDKLASIPGHISATDPGLSFNVYKDDPVSNPYHVVGPDVFFPTTFSFSPSSSSAKTNTKVQTQSASQTDGLVPASCLLKNANWCGVEVPSYNSETSCWASSENCYKQLEECYNSAPPTGSRGCKAWEEGKCAVIQRACRAGEWQGPPNKGVKMAFEEDANGGGEGAKIPGAANAGANDVGGNVGKGNQEQGNGQEEATPSATAVAAASSTAAAVAAPTETVKKSCKRMTIRERRRRN